MLASAQDGDPAKLPYCRQYAHNTGLGPSPVNYGEIIQNCPASLSKQHFGGSKSECEHGDVVLLAELLRCARDIFCGSVTDLSRAIEAE